MNRPVQGAEYLAPEIEILDIKVEQGFATSDGEDGNDWGVGGWGSGEEWGGEVG